MGKNMSTDTNAETDKVAFASPEWIALARTVLDEIVAEHGEEGKSFSACEAFTDAPPGVAGKDSTTAAWHFHIVGKAVTVGEGTVEAADMNVSADYETVLPMARLVYTPEMIEQTRQNPPQGDSESAVDASNIPPYLVELHNRMAVVTQ